MTRAADRAPQAAAINGASPRVGTLAPAANQRCCQNDNTCDLLEVAAFAD
jgi:hypothetical protein